MNSTPADLPAPNAGPGQSSDELFEAVYARLKAMAGGQLASRERGSLNTTALVHELYLRVTSNRELNFAHPAQFFAYAARAMRHLLSDRARDKLRQRAGGDWQRVTLTGSDARLSSTAPSRRSRWKRRCSSSKAPTSVRRAWWSCIISPGSRWRKSRRCSISRGAPSIATGASRAHSCTISCADVR